VDQPKSQHITHHTFAVSRDQRIALMGHRGVTVWLTGLSASGKTTIATLVDQMLAARGVHSFVLDGDNIRHALNRDLGFSPADREENIRRIGEVAKLFTQAGVINLTAFISPYRSDRDRNRALQETGDFVEVYVNPPLEVCEQRDPRGLYRKARAGEIKEFTGISAPYEPPLHPELEIHTESETPVESALRVIAFLEEHGYISAGTDTAPPPVPAARG
jgi:adenylylsulfate kinase